MGRKNHEKAEKMAIVLLHGHNYLSKILYVPGLITHLDFYGQTFSYTQNLDHDCIFDGNVHLHYTLYVQIVRSNEL